MTSRSPYLVFLCAIVAVLALAVVACGPGEEASDTAAPADTAAAPDTPAAAAGPTGTASVTGTITFAGDKPNLQPINMAADPTCAEKNSEPVYPDLLVLGDGDTLGNIFVKVANAPDGNYPAPSEPVVVDQRGCRYIPHVAGVIAGQPLQFRNSDGILHNVHGLPEANPDFNLGMPPSLEKKDVVLNRPEPLFEVKCDVHPWMQSYVAVMSHPYFDVTETDGQFTIQNLPAGTYTIEAWHERLGTQTQEVTVGDGESATVDFRFETPAG